MHVEERRVSPTLPEATVESAPVPPFIRIHSSRHLPADAFVAVPCRNHWSWIDDRDMRLKTLCRFIMLFCSITETEGREGAPIIIIPSG
jgi:hypothetical protein